MDVARDTTGELLSTLRSSDEEIVREFARCLGRRLRAEVFDPEFAIEKLAVASDQGGIWEVTAFAPGRDICRLALGVRILRSAENPDAAAVAEVVLAATHGDLCAREVIQRGFPHGRGSGNGKAVALTLRAAIEAFRRHTVVAIVNDPVNAAVASYYSTMGFGGTGTRLDLHAPKPIEAALLHVKSCGVTL